MTHFDDVTPRHPWLHRGYLEVAAGWERVGGGRVGPFVCREVLRRPDGTLEEWRSRAHRLRPSLLDGSTGSTWWAPGALVWWIAVLFAVGSTCFAVGAAPGYAAAVGSRSDALTFFVGSIFFTSAAYLQYLQVINVDRGPGSPGGRRVLSFEGRRIDWWAAAVQLVGTVLFNVNTFDALLASTPQHINRFVWLPDMFGSACFLISSWLAWAEEGVDQPRFRPRSPGWWVVLLNLVGSVFFGLSAVGSFVLPSTGQLRNSWLAGAGTFLGALCFLAGAVLLLPDRAQALRTGPLPSR